MFTAKHKISDDYIRGLVEGEGCFTFCKSGKSRIPTFLISMHYRDKALLQSVKHKLKLKGRIYELRPYTADGYERAPTVRIMVRNLDELKNSIIPFFYKKLVGFKGEQFTAWINQIGSKSDVPEKYKILHRLREEGYWDNFVID